MRPDELREEIKKALMELQAVDRETAKLKLARRTIAQRIDELFEQQPHCRRQ
jgi:DUF1680 family protein